MDTQKPQKTDLKSVLLFVLLTFAGTWGLEYALINGGLRFDTGTPAPALWMLLIMWIPGLSGLLVTRFVENTPFNELAKSLSLRVGSYGPYFLTFIIVPVIFLIIYAGTYALGLSGLDTNLTGLSGLNGEPIDLETWAQTTLLISVFLGPIINVAFGLGEEIGWRGFLLPRLMGLGKPTAYVALGILWGLWHAPLIHAGFNYPGYPFEGVLMMCALSFAFGIFLNEMTLHYQSVLLPAFIHGAVNAQGSDVWIWLFPDVNPMLGGATGAVAVAVWLAISAMTMFILKKMRS